MNRQQRRQAAKLGHHVIYAQTFFTVADGKRAWWWVETTEHMSNEEAVATKEWHGPFGSEQEAEANKRLVLLGPDCKVTEGGRWDPAWDKPQ